MSYTRHEDGHLSNGCPAYVHAVDASDRSPAHSEGAHSQGYDSRCGWCYLGAPHTVNAHAQKIAAAQ